MQHPDESIGTFSVSPDLMCHPESLMYLVANSSGKFPIKIATVGFGLLHRKDGTVLSINNVQGVYGQSKKLDIFSKSAGELWPIYLCKKLVAHAREKGFKVEGELPWPFHEELEVEPTARDYVEKEYRRQVGHYEQTFHNLGMKKVRGKWILPSE